MSNSEEEWKQRMKEAEARKKYIEENEHEYDVRISGNIAIDVDETYTITASSRQQAIQYAKDAIDVDELAATMADQLDFDIDDSEEE